MTWISQNFPKGVIGHNITQLDPTVNAYTLELYDSGATCHMTLIKEPLINHQPIPPKLISAMNQCIFDAMGGRDLMIHIPNGPTHSKILIWGVLHTLDITMTLVSIGLISDTRYSILFKGRMCIIHDGYDNVVGKFAKWDSLYKVDKNGQLSASANRVAGPLTAMDAHC